MYMKNEYVQSFLLTHGRQRSAMDEELLRDGIARWNPSAGDSNKCGKIEVFNRVLVGAVNVALRRGGAKNVFAYDCATHFETHFNMSPTSFNIVGGGEAPFKTLGIPMCNEKLVRFFCPAWLTPPKQLSVETGEAVNQIQLAMRKVRCFIIGYGSGMTEGGDSDGYKVVVAVIKKKVRVFQVWVYEITYQAERSCFYAVREHCCLLPPPFRR